jgi:hypothetical protein
MVNEQRAKEGSKITISPILYYIMLYYIPSRTHMHVATLILFTYYCITSTGNPNMRAVVRAYSPIQKQYTIDKSKPHAWMEKKDHDEEIRNTLKDIHGRPSSPSSSSLKHKQHKPSVDSFMSPMKTKKARETSTSSRRGDPQHGGAANNNSADSAGSGRDNSLAGEESKCFLFFFSISLSLSLCLSLSIIFFIFIIFHGHIDFCLLLQ